MTVIVNKIEPVLKTHCLRQIFNIELVIETACYSTPSSPCILTRGKGVKYLTKEKDVDRICFYESEEALIPSAIMNSTNVFSLTSDYTRLSLAKHFTLKWHNIHETIVHYDENQECMSR